jgi:hypothetical protein
MVADAIYLFPEAGKRIVALGSTQQGAGNFIPMINSTFSAKISLDSSHPDQQNVSGIDRTLSATGPCCFGGTKPPALVDHVRLRH